MDRPRSCVPPHCLLLDPIQLSSPPEHRTDKDRREFHRHHHVQHDRPPRHHAGHRATVTIASFVGTSLESYDFYLFAYFSAFFVGPLFFAAARRLRRRARRLPHHRGRLRHPAARRHRLRPPRRPHRPAPDAAHHDPDHGHQHRPRRPAAHLRRRRLVRRDRARASCGWSRVCRSAANGAARSCSRPSTPTPSAAAFYASLPQLGSPVGSILSAVVFIALSLAARPGADRRVGLAHPVPDGHPAAARLALPALVDRRDARLQAAARDRHSRDRFPRARRVPQRARPASSSPSAPRSSASARTR